MLSSHARNWNEFQTPCHRHSATNIQIPSFQILVNPKLVWNSWNLACYHRPASTCRGKKIVPFGTGLCIRFSKTRASHNKPDGFGRERATFWDESISVASNCFNKICSVNIEQQFVLNFGMFRGSFVHFYTLTGFSRHFMCIIQIWTTRTCSSAPKLAEKSYACPWVNV
jgi:hypothetical protein